MQGDTVQSLDAFVKEVHDEIDGWGMAGNGLVLAAGHCAQRCSARRAASERFGAAAKNSGLELRTDEVANNAARKVQ